MLLHHGERIGLKHARKHIGWALDSAAATAQAGEEARKRWRRHVLTAPDRRETERRLDESFAALAWRVAA
jgi:tRNA-dihydrouridine synthase B